MKPQLIAKRNAEIRRKEEAHRIRTTEPDAEIQHSFGSDRATRAREITVATSQGILGIVLILVGLLFIAPIIGIVPLLTMTAPGVGATLIFAGIFLAVFVLIGIAIMRVGIRMLREAWFQQSVSPGLRVLRKLSFDAVPVMAFTVGRESVTNQVLISFDTGHEISGMLRSLAEELSDSDVLTELTGNCFLPGRRRRLPKELTGGRTVYLADLQVKHVTVNGVVRKREALACVAEPGSGGRIVATQ